MLKILLLIIIIGGFLLMLRNELRNAPLAEEQEDGSIRYVKENKD